MQSIILKSLLEYPEFKDEFEQRFSPVLFSGKYQVFCQKILSLNPLSFESFVSVLSDDEKQSEEFLNLCAAVCVPDFLEYEHILKDTYKLNAQKHIGEKLIRAAQENQLLDLSLFESELTLANNDFMNFKQWLEYYKNKPVLAQIKSGISFIDSAFNGGFELAQLVLISGDAEAGKTSLGLQLLENISRVYPVCFFCFEFTIEQYLKRKTQNVPFKQENFFMIDDGYNINEIAQNIKILSKRGVKIFLIDSQMRITSPRARNMEEEESLKFSTLAKLAHQYELLIFLIIQTAKGDRDNPMGSKKGTHEASAILRVERIEADKKDASQFNKEFDPNKRLFLVRKNKQTGKHFKEIVRFNDKTLTFCAMSKNTDQPVQEVDFEKIQESIF